MLVEPIGTLEDSTSDRSSEEEEEEEEDDDDNLQSVVKPVVVDINAPTERDLDLLKKHRRSIVQGRHLVSTVPQEPTLQAALRAKVMSKIGRIIAAKNITKTMSAEKNEDNRFILQHQRSLEMVKTQSKAALLKISAKDLQEVEKRRRQQQRSLSREGSRGSKRGLSPNTGGGGRGDSPTMSSSGFRLHSPMQASGSLHRHTTSPRGASPGIGITHTSLASFHRHATQVDEGYFVYSANRAEREQEDMKKIVKHVRLLKPLATAQRHKEHMAEQWKELQKFTPVSRHVRLLGIVKESAQNQKVEKAGLEALEHRTALLLQSLRIKNHQLSVNDAIEAKVLEAERIEQPHELSRSAFASSGKGGKGSTFSGSRNLLSPAKGQQRQLDLSAVFEKSVMLQSVRIGGGFRNGGGGDSPRGFKNSGGGGLSPRREHGAVAILVDQQEHAAHNVGGGGLLTIPKAIASSTLQLGVAPSSSSLAPNPSLFTPNSNQSMSLLSSSMTLASSPEHHRHRHEAPPANVLLDDPEVRAVILFSMLVFTLVVTEVRFEGSLVRLLREEPTVAKHVCLDWMVLLATVLPSLFSKSRTNEAGEASDSGDDESATLPELVDIASWVWCVMSTTPKLQTKRSLHKWKVKDVKGAVAVASLPAHVQQYGLTSVQERLWRSIVLDALAPQQQLQPSQRAIAATCRSLLTLKVVPGFGCPGQLAARSWCLSIPVSAELLSLLPAEPGDRKSFDADATTFRPLGAAEQRQQLVSCLYSVYLRMCKGLCCCPRCHVVSGSESTLSTARQLFDPAPGASPAVSTSTVSRGLSVEQFTSCGFMTHVPIAEHQMQQQGLAGSRLAETPGRSSGLTPDVLLSPAYTTVSSPSDPPLGSPLGGPGLGDSVAAKLMIASVPIAPPPTRKQLLSAIRVAFFSYDEDEDGALSFFEVAKMLMSAARDVLKSSLTRATATSAALMINGASLSQRKTDTSPLSVSTTAPSTAVEHITQHLALQLGITGEDTSSCADRAVRKKVAALEEVVEFLATDCHVLGVSLVA